MEINEIVEKEKNPKEGFWFVFFDLFLNLVFIFLFVVLIRHFLISPFHVFGASMCDTLNFIDGKCKNGYGEYIIVNKAGYLDIAGVKIGEPKRGDIVVFKPPHIEEEYFIKRVIGLPGETVVIKDGLVYLRIDGEDTLIEEPYLNEENNGSTLVKGSRDEAVFDVPDGQYFVMGDNRNHSTDSRLCFGVDFASCDGQSESAYLPKKNISGRAWLTLWPFAKIRFIGGHEYESL